MVLFAMSKMIYWSSPDAVYDETTNSGVYKQPLELVPIKKKWELGVD